MAKMEIEVIIYDWWIDNFKSKLFVLMCVGNKLKLIERGIYD